MILFVPYIPLNKSKKTEGFKEIQEEFQKAQNIKNKKNTNRKMRIAEAKVIDPAK